VTPHALRICTSAYGNVSFQWYLLHPNIASGLPNANPALLNGYVNGACKAPFQTRSPALAVAEC
jgi:hypothetical protein